MKATISLPNGSTLLKALRRLPQEAQEEAVLALKKAARAVKEEARTNHAFTSRSGQLENAIDYMVNDRLLSAKVGVNLRGGHKGRNIPYAKAVHDGSKPHDITPKNGRALRWQGASGFTFARRVRHPGYAGDPFLDNALKQTEPEIIRLMVDGIEAAIRKAGFV